MCISRHTCYHIYAKQTDFNYATAVGLGKESVKHVEEGEEAPSYESFTHEELETVGMKKKKERKKETEKKKKKEKRRRSL